MKLLKKIGNFFWSRSFLINFGALLVVYVGVFISLKSCLNSTTNHGEKIEVPNLIGKNSNNVKQLLAGTGLSFEVLDSIYAPSKTVGTILEQDPKSTLVSDLYVKSGRTIKLRVSKRVMLVEMPALIDKSQRFAEGILRNRKFRYDIEFKPSREADGAVIDQIYKGKTIEKGSMIPIGSRITLLLGRNEIGVPVGLPNLYGLTIAQAKERVESMLNMEFFVGSCIGCETSADSSIARVYTQSPEYEPRSFVASGGSITIVATKDFVVEDLLEQPEESYEIP